MIKSRSARYCNLKLLLIFLVVYGHLIEPEIRDCPWLMAQYRWIYHFHMPLFSFLSGLFLRDEKSCTGQLQRLLPLYLIAQTAAVIFFGAEALTPCWYLWYLLSVCMWTGLGWLWFRRRSRKWLPILLASILAGCAAGLVPGIGRTLSLSRSAVFFPYFFAGLNCRPDFPWERLRFPGVMALGLAAVIMETLGREIPVAFLYHAEAYGDLENGFLLRLVCYGAGACLCLFALSFVPDRRFPFTKAGADTMPAYLAHCAVVGLGQGAEIAWALAGAYLYVVFKLTQWHKLYRIERRDSPCRRSGKSTNNTPSRSTVSCCPSPGAKI